MIWLVLAILVLALVLRQSRIRFYRGHWQRLRMIVSDLAQGRKPRSFVFHQAPGFTQVALDLEKVYEQLLELRQRSSDQEYSLKTLLASMAEGVLVIDNTRTIRLANRALLTMLELREEPVGRTILSGIRSAELDALVRQTFDSGRAQNREIAFEGRLRGGDRFFEVNVVPLSDPLAKTKEAVAVFHDISRLRRLEELRREFVANVSHELKTPLSIFKGYLETLEEPGLEPGQVAEVVAIMKRHSERLNAILEDLLSLARLEARSVKLELAEVDVADLMAQLARDWRQHCAAKGVGLEQRIQAGLPRLKADPMRLHQALNNLLQNALKYTPAGGTITLRAELGPEGLCLAVSDTGTGIPPEDLPHIFERFYRVEKGRSRESGGTGLGLSIVKHIMALHGGVAEASSEYGKGTTLRLKFR